MIDYLGHDACLTSLGQAQQVATTQMASVVEGMYSSTSGDKVASLAMVVSVVVSQLCGLGQSTLVTTLLNQVNAALPDGHEILFGAGTTASGNPTILTTLRYSDRCVTTNGGTCSATAMLGGVMQQQQQQPSGTMQMVDYTGMDAFVGYSRLGNATSTSTCLASMLGSSSSTNNLVGVVVYKISEASQQRAFLSQVVSTVNSVNNASASIAAMTTNATSPMIHSIPVVPEAMLYSTLVNSSTSTNHDGDEDTSIPLLLATIPRYVAECAGNTSPDQAQGKCKKDVAATAAMEGVISGPQLVGYYGSSYSSDVVIATAAKVPSLGGYLILEAKNEDMDRMILDNVGMYSNELNSDLPGTSEILIGKPTVYNGSESVEYLCAPRFMNESITVNSSFSAMDAATLRCQFGVEESTDYRGQNVLVGMACIPDHHVGMFHHIINHILYQVP